MKIVVTVCATENYCYAMRELGRRVAANIIAAKIVDPGVAVICGDNSKEVRSAVEAWKNLLPEGWEVRHVLAGSETAGAANYKAVAQMLIAKLRSAAFAEARRLQADFCWSLDSDTLPPANALRCMLTMLEFDNGYYSVSTCPYPNQLFLGGRGTPQHPIAQDFLDSERVIPDELKAAGEVLKAEGDALQKEAETTEPGKITEPPKEWLERKKVWEEKMRAHAEKVKECPPDGHIWQVTGKHGWRQRGWLDFAYPGIGVGAVVPSDWCGFGCTGLSAEALAAADFTGYDGQGTEDLYIVWKRWYPRGLRINVITHCPCDHVIWAKKKGGDAKEYTLVRSSHEIQGECVGHLRTQQMPWTEF